MSLKIPNQIVHDLGFVSSLDNDMTDEFCKLVTHQLSKCCLLDSLSGESAVDTARSPSKSQKQSATKFGISQKVLESAARKLGGDESGVDDEHTIVTPEMVGTTLSAIANLFVESAKMRISPTQLETFLLQEV